jgi:hypothetical protein
VCETLKKNCVGPFRQKAWNADIWCGPAVTKALLEHFNWELFDHPPYSRDLATSDYHLFYLSEELVGITAFQEY